MIQSGIQNIHVSELKHYGIKGMRWGKRKAQDTSSSEATVVSDAKGRGKIKTSGGRNLGSSKEAIQLALLTQTSKASGTKALSNDDLQTAIRRMQLEQQFSQLQNGRNTSVVAEGQKFAKELLGLGTTANQAIQFASSPAGQQIQKSLAEAKTK